MRLQPGDDQPGNGALQQDDQRGKEQDERARQQPDGIDRLGNLLPKLGADQADLGPKQRRQLRNRVDEQMRRRKSCRCSL